jgi:protein involved in polysaccharide export with SLBB domain
MRAALCLLLVSALVAVPAPVRAQSPAAPLPGPLLRPGDAVQITVWRKPELSGEFVVAADSALADPFYQDVKVAGMSMAEVTSRILAYVAQYEQNPRIRVEPLFRVSIGGEVREPNMYHLRAGTTIGEAVMLAGGVSERGRLDRVRLVRDGDQLVLDLARPQPGMAQSTIRSGDQIFVGRRTWLLKDYVAPASSVIGAAVSIIYLVTR